MKKLITFIFFAISTICAYSQTDAINPIQTDQTVTESTIHNQEQQPVSSLLMKDAYKNTPEWGKYKALRAVGWTTFGVGVTAAGVGTIVSLALASIHGSNSDKTKAGPIILCSGLGLTVASIPILFSAYHYRNKAKKIGMSMGLTQISKPTINQNLSYTPAMNFTIIF